ncbi:hypothetical protein HKX48_006991, partial [Thoreauomyces humboldtii]
VEGPAEELEADFLEVEGPAEGPVEASPGEALEEESALDRLLVVEPEADWAAWEPVPEVLAASVVWELGLVSAASAVEVQLVDLVYVRFAGGGLG